jgi:glycerophosphoryl diester phosphodiesterase
LAARFAFLDHSGVLAFAHRGGALEAPENTLAAFQYAVDLGYRYIETDVHATRDGVLIAFHDDKLDRVTNAKGRIAELDYAQVKAARIGGEHSIPLLADLLTAWPDLRINIDPKADSSVEPLIRVLKDMKAADRVCIGAFSDARIARIRNAFDGKICTSMGPRTVLRFRAASYGVPVGDFVEGALQVPVRAYGMKLVDRRFVRAANARGLQVHVWTIDEAAEMEWLISMGVHGIMTDRPRLLKEVLTNRGKWPA